jgi:hypothetical protein
MHFADAATESVPPRWLPGPHHATVAVRGIHHLAARLNHRRGRLLAVYMTWWAASFSSNL